MFVSKITGSIAYIFLFYKVAHLILVEHTNEFADRNPWDGKNWYTTSQTGKTKAQQSIFISPASMDRCNDGQGGGHKNLKYLFHQWAEIISSPWRARAEVTALLSQPRGPPDHWPKSPLGQQWQTKAAWFLPGRSQKMLLPRLKHFLPKLLSQAWCGGLEIGLHLSFCDMTNKPPFST